AGNADDTALTPATVCTFQCLTHGVDVADALERVVNAATGHVDDVLNDIVNFFGVHEVGHAELLRHLDFARVDVDTDDAGRTNHPGALDDVQTDTTETEYGNGGARLNLHGEEHGADARGHTTADVADLVERRVLADFCQS